MQETFNFATLNLKHCSGNLASESPQVGNGYMLWYVTISHTLGTIKLTLQTTLKGRSF